MNAPKALFIVTVFALIGLFIVPSRANADLQLLKPLPSDPATFVGTGGYSADGLGQDGTGGTVQAEIPAGSTVVQAYLYASYFFNEAPSLADLTLNFDGTDVVLTQVPNESLAFLTAARADVTTQVATKVGGGGGITDFAINTDPPSMDGVALVVIYSNPSLPVTTIAVLDGGASQAGDTATFTFAAPLDKTVPGFSAIMSLGIGFGYQGVDGHVCGGGQFSTVDVNGTRLASCAGNYDDGFAANGGLITVGGVGDSILNPTDPNATTSPGGDDDELYNLEPLLVQGAPSVTVATANPSADDIIFLAVIAITAEASVTTEICDDGIDNDGDGFIDGDDSDCVGPPAPGTMTGGGVIGNKLATHGFTIWCDPTAGTSSLQVNWNKGKGRFHLTSLDTAVCTDDGTIDPGTPLADFDTFTGTGTGRYNNVPGATIEFTFTDAGEPGRDDISRILIKNAGGVTVLEIEGTVKGNHQAHP